MNPSAMDNLPDIKSPDRITNKSKFVAKPQYARNLAKKRIATLYLNGLDAYDIATETGFEVSVCKKTISTINKEMKELDKALFFRQVKHKLVQIVDNHSMISSEMIKLFMRAVDDKDDGNMARYARELTNNNLAFGKLLTLFGMGVGRDSSEKDILTSPTPSNITDLVEVSVDSPKDLEGIRSELKESMKRLTNYIEVVDNVDSNPLELVVNEKEV